MYEDREKGRTEFVEAQLEEVGTDRRVDGHAAFLGRGDLDALLEVDGALLIVVREDAGDEDLRNDRRVTRGQGERAHFRVDVGVLQEERAVGKLLRRSAFGTLRSRSAPSPTPAILKKCTCCDIHLACATTGAMAEKLAPRSRG